MCTTEETIAFRISRKVTSHDILDIDYHNYVEFIEEKELTAEALKRRLYDLDLLSELKKLLLGGECLKYYITLPEINAMRSLEEELTIPESEGYVNNYLSDLLVLPEKFSLREKHIEEFQQTMALFEKSFRRVRENIDVTLFAGTDVLNTYDPLMMVNEAGNEELVSHVLLQIVRFMKVVHVELRILKQYSNSRLANRWLEDDYNSPALAYDSDVKPDFSIAGYIKDVYLQIPIEVKRNLKKLVMLLDSSSEINESQHKKAYTIIQQCLQYSILNQCPVFVITDYFQTIFLEIDFDNTLDKRNTRADGDLEEIRFKHRIIRNDSSRLTLRSFFCWLFYHHFKQKDKKQTLRERALMKQLTKRVRKPGEGNKSRQLKRNASLLKSLKSKTTKLLKLEANDLEIKVMKDNYGFSSVYSIPFDKFKTFFNPEAQYEGKKEVVLKVFDPKNFRGGRSCTSLEENVYKLKYATKGMIEYYEREYETYHFIEVYNNKVECDSLKVNIPKLLDHGAVVIFDCLGSIWLVGLYTVFSKIESTRPFMKEDIPKLQRQVKLLNEGARIEDYDLSKGNVIVNGDDVFLVDFEMIQGIMEDS